MQYLENWQSRFKFLPYVFDYNLNRDAPLLGDEVQFEEIMMNGMTVVPWLKENAKGRIFCVFDYTQHEAMSAINRQFGKAPIAWLKMRVAFSDKDLALLWKLTWGGKMVDGRGISYRLVL